MSLPRNSAPFAFRSFGRDVPTIEQLRQDLEKSFDYTQKRVDSLSFSAVRGTMEEAQAPFVTAGFDRISQTLVEGDAANASRIDSLDALITDPRTGLAQAHARISLAQRVQVTQNSALASQLLAVSAQVGAAQAQVVEERTARVTADGTIEATLATEVSARVSGDNTLSASVTAEASARIIADGNLSAKYTLAVTVSSGGVNVVTGMNLTSSINAGVTTSKVVFQAADFQIWNSTPDVGVAMFDISGTNVRLAGTLVVSTSGKVYIGTGTYGNTNTAFFVDDTGRMSLKDQFTWDGTTLDVKRISAVTGLIGGFSISSTTLSATGIGLDSSTPSFRIGTASAERAEMQISTGRARFAVYNSAGTLTGVLQGNDGVGGNAAFVQLFDSGSALTVEIIAASGKISGAVGSAANPTFSFIGDSDSGLYRHSADDIRMATGGAARLVVQNTRIVCLQDLKINNARVPGTPVAGGTVYLLDSNGATVQVLVV